MLLNSASYNQLIWGGYCVLPSETLQKNKFRLKTKLKKQVLIMHTHNRTLTLLLRSLRHVNNTSLIQFAYK